MKNDIKFDILDGDEDYQKRATECFLGELSEEEIEDSMSEKFAYLDED